MADKLTSDSLKIGAVFEATDKASPASNNADRDYPQAAS